MLLSAAVTLFSCGSRQSASSLPTAEESIRHLNIIVVTIDTLRPDHLHCYGYQKIETPVLDGLAKNGVLFENAVTQTPLTPPSHASIFTGQNPNVHGVRNTGGFILQSSARPLARILQEEGWDTGAFVSSAVLKKTFGFNNGFNIYDDQMPKPVKGADSREDPERRGGETVDRAVRWLEQQSGKPYFLWVHLYDPHLPYDPPGAFKSRYKNEPYDGEIAYADEQVGRLLAAVRKKSAADQTIVSVLSDHGESLGEHGEYTHGIFLYDSTLRIAFMMTGPGVPPGIRVKQQARSIDFLPTMLALLRIKPPANIQGISLVPGFTSGSLPTDISYEETLYPKLSMAWSELRAIRTNRWKYVRAPKAELYDLAADPRETSNIIQQHPGEVQKFEAQLNHLISPAGASTAEKIETNLVDQRLMDQLKSLGYLSGFAPRSYELTGKGVDPKDRVDVLKLLYLAEESSVPLSVARRIQLLEKALAEDPKSPSLYYQLGSALEKAGRQEQALNLYRNALSRGVENGRLHSRIADLSLRKGDKDTAITEYEKAAQFNPSDLESQNNLAMAYLEKGRLADSERVFHWILTTDPDNAAANNGMGLTAIQKHDPVAARSYFEKAAQLDPDLVEAHMNLGLLYEMAGDRVRAREAFEAFLAKASPAQYGSLIPKVKEELAGLR
jgi:choline-sulfatase